MTKGYTSAATVLMTFDFSHCKWHVMSIKRTVKQIRVETIDGIEFVDVVFLDGSELRVKGPRVGTTVNEREADGKLVDVEFEGFELA